MFKSTLIVLAVAAVLIAWAVTRPAAPKPFADDYRRALQQLPGSDIAIDAGLENFERVYGELTHPSIGERVAELYAEQIYFNDSLKTFKLRQSLVEYMEATAAMLEDSTVEIDQVLRDGNDVFVRWTMTFRSSALGKEIVSNSVGMTHLRFDADAQIVLHQDFWDSASGLYRNLPVIGYALDKVDGAMTN